VFITNSSYSTLNGTVAIPSADVTSTNLTGIDVLKMPTGVFNAVRAGPISVRWVLKIFKLGLLWTNFNS
jgi:hypothetical protein